MMRCPQCLQLIGISTATGVCAACVKQQQPGQPQRPQPAEEEL